MTLTDSLYYVLFTNPISATTLDISKQVALGVINSLGIKPKTIVEKVIIPPDPLWLIARPCIRIAALSGAAAMILAAYGSHRNYSDEKGVDQKIAFDTASRYHFFHTLAILSLPMCRRPLLAGTFMVSGILMFCGTCYYFAFTGQRTYSKMTPIGGLSFILGWLGMLL